ncbi:MAG: hypothetical protein K5863_17335 [Nitratireductor sp.]|uniref:hypothetical protein n=1 Tax=Nitratireductor sp. TaxID=1872084 RepID=UPI002608C6D8|nr:hypothetical protein [Nitratireductor sp.]MCV0351844.1 hypothetical protein [Nitratireductor sp.]
MNRGLRVKFKAEFGFISSYLSVCTPDMAYKWLSEGANLYGFGRDRYEAILLGRNDPLIDLGLARYGESDVIAEELYQRLDKYSRCAMRAFHKASGGPSGVFSNCSDFSSEQEVELLCWVFNKYHDDDFFIDLFNKDGIFSDISDGLFLEIISAVEKNEKLNYVEEGRSVDYEPIADAKVQESAWNLTLRVPTTQEWAKVLWRLLRNWVMAGPHKFDALGAFYRWKVDDGSYDDNRLWSSQKSSVLLRSSIADLLDFDNSWFGCDDIALRCSFYRRFNPKYYDDWGRFLDYDGDASWRAVLENGYIWANPESRGKLREIAVQRDASDPLSYPLDSFKAKLIRYEKAFPDWFN